MPEVAVGAVIAAAISGFGSLVVAIVTLISGGRTIRLQLDAAREAAERQRSYDVEDAWREQRHQAHTQLLLLMESAVIRQRASAALSDRSGEQLDFVEIRKIYMRVLNDLNNELNQRLTSVLLLSGDPALDRGLAAGRAYQELIVKAGQNLRAVTSLDELEQFTDQLAPVEGSPYYELVGEYLDAAREDLGTAGSSQSTEVVPTKR